MRKRRRVEVAETRLRGFRSRRLGGDRTSISVWCRTVESAPSYRNQVRARDRVLTAPGPVKGQKRKNRSLGVVCLLTRGVLISVRPERPHTSALTLWLFSRLDGSRPWQRLCASLLDHLICKIEQVRGQRQAEGLGRLEVDDELKLHGLLHR